MLYFSAVSTSVGNVGQEEEICKAKQLVVGTRVSVCLCSYHGPALVWCRVMNKHQHESTPGALPRLCHHIGDRGVTGDDHGTSTLRVHARVHRRTIMNKSLQDSCWAWAALLWLWRFYSQLFIKKLITELVQNWKLRTLGLFWAKINVSDRSKIRAFNLQWKI